MIQQFQYKCGIKGHGDHEISGGLIPGYSEGGNYEMVENEHHQELFQVLEQKLFSMEGQAERCWIYMVV